MTDMLPNRYYIFIPFVAYVVLLACHLHRARSRSVLYVGLLLWYALSILANRATGLYSEYPFHLGSMLYLALGSVLFIYPFTHFKHQTIQRILPLRHFRITAEVFILLNLASIMVYLPDAIVHMLGNIGDMRTEVLETVAEQGNPNPVMTILWLSQATFFIPLTLFFYSVVRRENGLLQVALLIASFSKVVFHLSQVGRTGMLLWVLCFGYNYLVFRQFMPRQATRTMQKVALGCLGSIVIVFAILSYQRFVDSHRSFGRLSPLCAVLDYYGHAPVRFDAFYEADYTEYYYGVHLFPLYYRILNRVGLADLGSLSDMYDGIKEFGEDDWYYFATFLRELWYNFGPWGTLACGLAFGFLVRRLCPRKKQPVSLKRIMLVYYLLTVPFMGLLSLSIACMDENYALLLLLLV